MAVIHTSVVNGKTYGFDFQDQRIDVDATVDNMLVTDLWTAIKDAQDEEEGIVYDVIAYGSGNDVLGTGIETFLTVTLQDNWEVNTLKSSGKFEVSGGNLIREDQADPFRDNPAITYIAFLSQAGIATQIETGVSGLTSEESVALLNIPTNPLLTTDSRLDNLATIAVLQNLIDELHKLNGLDAANQLNITPTSRTVGSISQTLSGDGISGTIVKRN